MNLRVPSIQHDDCDELAALCKAGGDPLRLNVLRALANDSFGVLELAQIFAIGQSGMSHHLKVLAQAGLVATRREGNAVFYRRALPHGELLGGTLHGALLDAELTLGLPPAVTAATGIDAMVHAIEAFVSTGHGPLTDPHALEAMRLINFRIAADLEAGGMDVALASATKVYGSESMLEILRRLMDIVGNGSLVRAGSSAAYLLGELEYEIRANTINTFGGGTNEIQRELIAQFGLGMPRPVR